MSKELIFVSDIGQTLTEPGVGVYRNFIKENKARITSLKDLTEPAQDVKEKRNEIYSEAYLSLKPKPNALEGITDMADRYRFMGYFTIRSTAGTATPEKWLRQNSFPRAENVNRVRNDEEKIAALLKKFVYQLNQGKPVMLVDDRLQELIDGARKLQRKSYPLARLLPNLLIVGIGQHNKPIKTNELGVNVWGMDPMSGVQTLWMPDWSPQSRVILHKSLEMFHDIDVRRGKNRMV